jgi:threonine aldolase
MKRGFASDNNAGVHPAILAAMVRANSGHTRGYGDDDYTREAEAAVKAHFGESCHPFFVFNGTGGNVIGLQTLLRSYEAVICSENSHIHVDECGAPERFTGCKLLTVPTPDGKLTPELVERHMHGFGDVHHVQPKVISITQATEVGTVYTVPEIRALADYAHGHGCYLYMDGARFANAAASLGASLREISVDAGIDVLTFGGTKNGLMFGEALLVFHEELAKSAPYLRKQAMQLASKMRFLSTQFTAILENDLWLQSARHANGMAKLLGDQVRQIPGVTVTQDVQANAVFAVLPAEAIQTLQSEFSFYTWDEARNEVRWVCSFDTTEDDIAEFVSAIRHALAS